MKVSPMWLDACVCMRNADTGAGVPRGATVRTECNWAKSSHAGAQPASFVVIVCLSLSLSLSLSLCVSFVSLFFSPRFAAQILCKFAHRAMAASGQGPGALAKRRYTWESEIVQRHFIRLVFRRASCDSGSGDGPQRPRFDSRWRGLLVARPGGAGRPKTSGQPITIRFLCECCAAAPSSNLNYDSAIANNSNRNRLIICQI